MIFWINQFRVSQRVNSNSSSENEFNRLTLCASWLNQHCESWKVSVSKYNLARVRSSIDCLTDEEVIAFLEVDGFYDQFVYPKMDEEDFEEYYERYRNL